MGERGGAGRRRLRVLSLGRKSPGARLKQSLGSEVPGRLPVPHLRPAPPASREPCGRRAPALPSAAEGRRAPRCPLGRPWPGSPSRAPTPGPRKAEPPPGLPCPWSTGPPVHTSRSSGGTFSWGSVDQLCPRGRIPHPRLHLGAVGDPEPSLPGWDPSPWRGRPPPPRTPPRPPVELAVGGGRGVEAAAP